MKNHSNHIIKKIVDSVLYLEKKHNLLEWKILEVYAWQSARNLIYIKLANSIIPNNSSLNNRSFRRRTITLTKRLFINSIIFNPYFDFIKTKVLIFDSGRRYLRDSNYIDIYTEYLCKNLDLENIKYTLYNTSYLVDELSPRNFNIKHLDFIYLFSKLASFLPNITLDKKTNSKISHIEKEIYSLLGVKIDLKTILINEITHFKTSYPFYKFLFKIKQPERIYLTSSGDKASMIKAAKDCNICVIELQHGLNVKESLISHFPNTLENSLDYFPNKFFIWKDLDMCTCKLPLSKENIEYFPNEHLINMISKNRNIVRNQNQILIVSQPYNSKEILGSILIYAEELKDWSFVYKIHPTENRNYFADSSEYEFSKYTNLNFVDNERSIYQLFSESKYVIGVFSTALFEASYFGCKILLLDLPGVEMAMALVKTGKAKLISKNDNLVDYIV